MLASTSLNAILGQSALILGLVGVAVRRARRLGMAVRTGNRRRAAHGAALRLAGARRGHGRVRRHGAGVDHPRLARWRTCSRSGRPRRRRCTTSPPCGARSRAASCCGSLVLAGYTAAVMRKYRRRLDDPLVGWALVVMFAVSAFFFFLAFGPTDAFKTGRRGRLQPVLPGPEPAAAEPHPRAVPPADPVPRLRRLHRAVRLRHRRADHRARRRGLAGRDPPLGAVRAGAS